MLLNLTLSLSAALALSALGWGQASDPADQQTIQSLAQQVKALQEQSRELQERIKVLEANQKEAIQNTPLENHHTEPSAQKTPPIQQTESAPETTASAPAQHEPASSIPVALPEMHSIEGIQWRGFGEVDYKVLNQRTPETGTYGFVPGSAGSFYTGDFGLFLTSRLTDKTGVLGELDFEEGDAQSFKIDLRRMLLKCDLSDHFKFSFGRFQTTIGYYNWAFRSAAWLQTTADRPLVMEFATDGGILPTQAVGVSVTGSIPSGKLGMHYVAEYGSSDTIRPDITGDGLFNDENNSNLVNIGAYFEPDFVRGLRFGGSIYHDRISDLVINASGASVSLPGEPAPDTRWEQTIVNGHVVYIAKGIEFLNEGFLIRHALIGGSALDTFHTSAFYTQISKKFSRIRPFARYQYVNASSRNQIFDDIGYRAGPSVGARFDLNDYLAIKAQLDHTLRRGLPDIDGLHLQLSGTF